MRCSTWAPAPGPLRGELAAAAPPAADRAFTSQTSTRGTVLSRSISRHQPANRSSDNERLQSRTTQVTGPGWGWRGFRVIHPGWDRPRDRPKEAACLTRVDVGRVHRLVPARSADPRASRTGTEHPETITAWRRQTPAEPPCQAWLHSRWAGVIAGSRGAGRGPRWPVARAWESGRAHFGGWPPAGHGCHRISQGEFWGTGNRLVVVAGLVVFQRGAPGRRCDPADGGGSVAVMPVRRSGDRGGLVVVGGQPGLLQPQEFFDDVGLPQPAVRQALRGVGITQVHALHPVDQLGQQLVCGVGGGGLGQLGNQTGQLVQPGREGFGQQPPSSGGEVVLQLGMAELVCRPDHAQQSEPVGVLKERH